MFNSYLLNELMYLPDSLPTPAEARVVDAKNQVRLHMEVCGSGKKGEAVEAFL